jgi:hypothetical protein
VRVWLGSGVKAIEMKDAGWGRQDLMRGKSRKVGVREAALNLILEAM